MSTTADPAMLASPAIDSPSLEEVIVGLGNVPLSRILARPAPGQATEADLLAVNESKNRLCELVDGILVEKPMGFEESLLAMMLGHMLLNYLLPRDLGMVTGPDGAMKLAPGLVRVPDVAVFLWDALPGRQIPKGRLPEAVPSLAVEVLSASNTKSEMDRKRREYFDAGVRIVWLVDPKKRVVLSYRNGDKAPKKHGEGAEIEDLDFLPGFRLAVGELFGHLGRKGQEGKS
jgi:Uma2 family endonuclease